MNDNESGWPFEKVGFAFIACAALAGLQMSGLKMAGGILSGGLIGIANFKWLGSIIKGAFSEGNKAGYTIKYLLKFLFVIGSSSLLIFSKVVDPLGFITGFTLIVITVTLKGTDLTNRS